MGDDDPVTWALALALGLGLMTYPSTTSLRPAPRPLVIPPTPAAHCDGCITSFDEGATLTLSRQLDGPLLASVLVQTDRAPEFRDRVDLVAGGVGMGGLASGAPFGGHVELLLGAAQVRGPVDATSFVIGSRAGIAFPIARGLYLGLSATYAQLFGEQPAGNAGVSTYDLELVYGWR